MEGVRARRAAAGGLRGRPLSDGRPHATPVWIDLDGDEIVFTTWHEGVKARVLTREPRLSLCVQDDQPPFAFVSIQGVAEVIDDVEAVKVWAAGSVGGSWAPTAPRSTAARTAFRGELLVRVRPTKVVGFVEMAGAPATS